VYVNGRFLTQPLTGVQRYAAELLKAFDRLLDTGRIASSRFDPAVLAPPGAKLEGKGFRHIPIRTVGRTGGHLWEQVELPFYARDGILVSPCNTGPVAAVRQVITLHDASVFAMPYTFSPAFRNWYRLLWRMLARRVPVVLTDSEFSRAELCRYLGIGDGRVRVVYLGGEHALAAPADRTVLERSDLNGGPFLLAVGSMSHRKNLSGIIRALPRTGDNSMPVVITGGINPKVFGQLDISLPENVRWIGHVSDSELRCLYENAAAFIYPSLYEGFGFPALEAMACGCPVIAADIPPLHEVCGEAGLYCDPYDPNDIAHKIQTVMRDSSLRAQLKARGLERAAKFSWERCARETLQVIEDVLAS
jgi:glycosyltransferase involved in cell wall biosynthesis